MTFLLQIRLENSRIVTDYREVPTHWSPRIARAGSRRPAMVLTMSTT